MLNLLQYSAKMLYCVSVICLANGFACRSSQVFGHSHSLATSLLYNDSGLLFYLW